MPTLKHCSMLKKRQLLAHVGAFDPSLHLCDSIAQEVPRSENRRVWSSADVFWKGGHERPVVLGPCLDVWTTCGQTTSETPVNLPCADTHACMRARIAVIVFLRTWRWWMPSAVKQRSPVPFVRSSQTVQVGPWCVCTLPSTWRSSACC